MLRRRHQTCLTEFLPVKVFDQQQIHQDEIALLLQYSLGALLAPDLFRETGRVLYVLLIRLFVIFWLGPESLIAQGDALAPIGFG